MFFYGKCKNAVRKIQKRNKLRFWKKVKSERWKVESGRWEKVAENRKNGRKIKKITNKFVYMKNFN